MAAGIGGAIGLDTRYQARRVLRVTCKKGGGGGSVGGGGQRRRAKRERGRAREIEKGSQSELIPRELVEHFEEDVKEPLVVGQGTKKERGGKRQNMGKVLSELDVRKLSREQVLGLMVRGAWVGIGVLAGVFVLVHFVIVRDLLPK